MKLYIMNLYQWVVITVGDKRMKLKKPNTYEIISILLWICLCLNIDWEWTNIKSFITGAVIGCQILLYIQRSQKR